MANNEEQILDVSIEDEMSSSYLTYAMSVIVQRALPDVRDGLKPVHRRILYSMLEMTLYPEKAYKKCAAVVGDVLGKYHPHGDMAVYQALVRMAQDFSLRYMLVNGQGNFGSVDGDSPAAMRYTECKMLPITMEMVKDLHSDTVDFAPNYDNSLKEPTVLPSAIPNLLVNGVNGIAVGMATNMPPHNIREIIDCTCAYIDNRDIQVEEMLDYVKGPDFPTSGIIHGTSGIKKAYLTGRGRAVIRARMEVENLKRSDREAIIVTELPYQVNKANLLIKIADLVKNKKIEGITDLRDESNRKGMRVVIELKRDADVRVIQNQLFKHTQMQTTFSIINLVLVNRNPKVLNLKSLLVEYVNHRKEVLIRKTQFDLKKAKHRAHILEGLLIALDNIDEVIKLIKESKDTQVAKAGLIENYSLSEIQATEILNMRLQRLTNLETQKIKDEHKQLLELIDELESILADETKQYGIIKDQLIEMKKKYGDDRKTEIVEEEINGIDIEELVQEVDNVVTITKQGYVKRMPTGSYRKQRRGGRGVTGISDKKTDDYVQHLFIASTHDYIMFFTNKGKVYFLKTHEMPETSRTARGKSIKLLLSIGNDEEIMTVLPVSNLNDESTHVFFVTKKGIVKKTSINKFVNARTKGVIAVKLDEDDELIEVQKTSGTDELMLYTRKGYALRFKEEQVRSMGRNSRGVKGIRLRPGDRVISMEKVDKDNKMLIITENGYGKLTIFDQFTPHNRGTGGQIYIKANEKTGPVCLTHRVEAEEEVILLTRKGMVIRLAASDIRTVGKSAMGVRLVKLSSGDKVMDVSSSDTNDNIEDEE